MLPTGCCALPPLPGEFQSSLAGCLLFPGRTLSPDEPARTALPASALPPASPAFDPLSDAAGTAPTGSPPLGTARGDPMTKILPAAIWITFPSRFMGPYTVTFVPTVIALSEASWAPSQTATASV